VRTHDCLKQRVLTRLKRSPNSGEPAGKGKPGTDASANMSVRRVELIIDETLFAKMTLVIGSSAKMIVVLHQVDMSHGRVAWEKLISSISRCITVGREAGLCFSPYR
jgi:hypothetical protein